MVVGAISWLKEIYKKLFRNIDYRHIDYLKEELKGSKTILDLGCGRNSPIKYCTGTYSVGVDLFEHYLVESKKKRIHNDYVLADVRNVQFVPKSFDTVVCLDVLEHLTKEEGYELIKKIKLVAKKKIVIFTPNGFLTQTDYDENPLQAHKSGWRAHEFRGLGFEVKGIGGLKFFRGERGKLKFESKIEILNKGLMLLSNLSQKIVYHFPRWAFQLLAVKHIKDGMPNIRYSERE